MVYLIPAVLLYDLPQSPARMDCRVLLSNKIINYHPSCVYLLMPEKESVYTLLLMDLLV